jgi:hypothetical protein
VLERVASSPLRRARYFLGAVVPVTGERLAVHDLADAVEPRPFPEAGPAGGQAVVAGFRN